MTEIPLNTTKFTGSEKKNLSKLSYWLITFGVIGILLLATFPLRTQLDRTILILIYSLFVLIISFITPGYSYGFVSAILCTFLFDFFINPPWDQFEFSIKFPITLLTMLTVTMISSAITAYMKEIVNKSQKREEESISLYQINQELVNAKNKEEIISITNRNLASQLKRSLIYYLGNPSEENSFVTTYAGDLKISDFEPIQELRSARHAYEEKIPTGYKTSYNGDRFIFYLPFFGNNTSGVIGVSCKNHPLEKDDKHFLTLVLSQTSLALERQLLQEQRRQSQLETEKEKMRNNLLRSVSHDLRTPLTSIIGASDSLLNNSLEMDRKEKKTLMQNIKEEAQWLTRIVENLLTVTQINDGNTYVETSPEVAEEVIAQAVRNVGKWYPEWTIHVKAPTQPLFVSMDATLISQVLLNLLENSIKHSTPDDLIFINLSHDDKFATFEISDNGTGISENLLENLFSIPVHSTIRSYDSTVGAGIGLSICNSIIKAHGGTISAKNKDTGGAVFTFKLPLEGRDNSNDAKSTNN